MLSGTGKYCELIDGDWLNNCVVFFFSCDARSFDHVDKSQRV